MNNNDIDEFLFSIRALFPNKTPPLLPGRCGLIEYRTNFPSLLNVTFALPAEEEEEEEEDQHEEFLYRFCFSMDRNELLSVLEWPEDTLENNCRSVVFFQELNLDHRLVMATVEVPEKVLGNISRCVSACKLYVTALISKRTSLSTNISAESQYNIVEIDFIFNPSDDQHSENGIILDSGEIHSGTFLFGVLGILVIFSMLIGTTLFAIVNWMKNKKIFDLNSIVTTTFSSSFVLPLDVKSSRILMFIIAIIDAIIIMPILIVLCQYNKLTLITLLFLRPSLAVISARRFSPLITLMYMFCTLLSILFALSLLVSSIVSMGSCSTYIDNPNLVETSSSSISCPRFLYIFSISFMCVVMLASELLAYSFVYRILRYRRWISQQAMLIRPKEFDYEQLL